MQRKAKITVIVVGALAAVAAFGTLALNSVSAQQLDSPQASEAQAATAAPQANSDAAPADQQPGEPGAALPQVGSDLRDAWAALRESDAYQETMTKAYTAAVNAALEAGDITQEQADLLLANNTSGWMGMGGMHGKGGMRGSRGAHGAPSADVTNTAPDAQVQ